MRLAYRSGPALVILQGIPALNATLHLFTSHPFSRGIKRLLISQKASFFLLQGKVSGNDRIPKPTFTMRATGNWDLLKKVKFE